MKRLIHLWLLAWVTIPAVTQEWVPMSSISPMETPQTEVTASSAQQFVCKVVIPGFYDTEVTRDGQTYHALALRENQTLQTVGEPALPVIIVKSK